MHSSSGATSLKRRSKAGSVRRISRTAAIGMAVTMALMTAGGVFAYLTDSVTLTGAEAQSNGLIAPEELLDLRVKSGPCASSEDIYDTAVFSDDAVISFSPSTAEFDFTAIAASGGGESVVDIPPRLCLANLGPVRGAVNLSILSYDSMEVGACSDAEEAAEVAMAKSGCTDLTQGELADVVDLVIREYCEGGDVGAYNSGSWDMWMIGNVVAMGDSGTPHEIAELDPGAHCTIDLELLARFAAADDSLSMAQTDSLSLTFALDLVEL